MKTGKLSNEQLQKLVLDKLPITSPSTMVGASIGADCAWLNLGDKILVTSSDPITAGGLASGTLAIHVSCNDIASCGIKPTGILIVIIAPPKATEEELVMIVEQASTEAKRLGVDIVGGHTEISESVNTFVVISTAFGIIDKSHPIPFGKAKPNDKLIITKSCGIEGSYIAAHEHKSKLEGKIDSSLIEEALTYENLISVVDEGSIAGEIINKDFLKNPNGFYYGAVNLMHDITEGGVFGAAYEMATYSGTGLRLYKEQIPISNATNAICNTLGLDPYRLISSGSLLISTSEPDRVLNKLSQKGIEATIIGEFTDAKDEYLLVDTNGDVILLDPPAADEIYKL